LARGFAPASRLGVADFALNLALFAPGGVLLRALGPGASACTALGALLSLGIESAQMWIPHRYPSQLDVLANALGALAGALAAGTWARRRKGEACGRRGAQAGSRTGAEGEARRRRRLPASP
jgi:glycopeptide antibiotics resistance protein